VTVRITDEALNNAITRAHQAADIAHGDVSQWAGIEKYAATRGDDPTPARAAVILDLLGLPAETSSDAAYEAAAQAMLNDFGASPLREQLVRWSREDFAVAEPLLAVFTGHGTDVEHPVIEVDQVELGKLARWLTAEQGSPVEIERAEVIGGGFSRRMWRATVRSEGFRRNVIVRVEQGGMFGTDTTTEVAAMRGLLAAGYRVPAIVHVEPTGLVLGEPFFVMEEVRGEVRLDDAGLDDIIRSVAELHKVPITAVDHSGRSAAQVISDNIDGWLNLYRAHAPMPIPLIEQGAAWLRANLEPTGPSVIVHGDAGPGNALFDAENGLTVLDWEFAHVGDAAEDWAYLALIRGRRTMSPEAWKARLAETIGLEYNEDQWRNWLAYNHFRGACVNLTALTVFLEGSHRTADQLAIGIAVHLRFLGQLLDITCAD
jgi:aminoglycoside phosphotransferase (APT) family kinase protein